MKVSVWDSRTWVKDYYNSDGAIYSYYKGQELGDIWGFRTDGYFLTNEEANNWAVDAFHKNGNNFRAFAGDLKFLDLDGNGKIELERYRFECLRSGCRQARLVSDGRVRFLLGYVQPSLRLFAEGSYDRCSHYGLQYRKLASNQSGGILYPSCNLCGQS